MGDLFSFDQVSLHKRERTVLDEVTLTVADHGITAIVGASGAGKSSLLRCCNRLEAPTSGTVRYHGDDVATLEPRAHRRRLAMVFQSPTPFPGSVLDNLRAVTPQLSRKEAAACARRVGLVEERLDQIADSLSGGEAQRLVLARALTTNPEVLLADEPTSALDAAATARLERLARTLADEGMPVIWVSHDLAQVQRLADHLVVMRQGRVVWTGPPGGGESSKVIHAALADSGG